MEEIYRSVQKIYCSVETMNRLYPGNSYKNNSAINIAIYRLKLIIVEISPIDRHYRDIR